MTANDDLRPSRCCIGSPKRRPRMVWLSPRTGPGPNQDQVAFHDQCGRRFPAVARESGRGRLSLRLRQCCVRPSREPKKSCTGWFDLVLVDHFEATQSESAGVPRVRPQQIVPAPRTHTACAGGMWPVHRCVTRCLRSKRDTPTPVQSEAPRTPGIRPMPMVFRIGRSLLTQGTCVGACVGPCVTPCVPAIAPPATPSTR